MRPDEQSLLSISPSESESPLVLALDIGTSSVRAAIYDARGREVRGAAASIVRRFETTPDGGFELDANSAISQVIEAVDLLFRQLPDGLKTIEAVGISCFWHSLMGVGAEGEPVTPLFPWADTRSAESARELRRCLDENEVHQRTGARLHPSYWPARLRWLMETAPQMYSRVQRWLSFSDFLFAELCGRTTTSVSIASGTGLMDQLTCNWDMPLLSALNVLPDKLPVIAFEDESPATLLSEFANRWPMLRNINWTQAIGDGAANNLGAGVTDKTSVALMIGTSGAMRVMFEGPPPEELQSGLWSYRLDRNRPLVGGALSDGGGLFSWAVRSLNVDGDSQRLEDELAMLEPDAHGLTILPFWSGERSTGWHDQARGAVVGLTLHTKPIEIVRAAMESIAYRFALIAETLNEVAPNARIIGSGGALTASPVWTQILADVIGRPVELSTANEASCRGAALWALASIGESVTSSATGKSSGREHYPNSAAQQIYQIARTRQQKVYERLIDGD